MRSGLPMMKVGRRFIVWSLCVCVCGCVPLWTLRTCFKNKNIIKWKHLVSECDSGHRAVLQFTNAFECNLLVDPLYRCRIYDAFFPIRSFLYIFTAHNSKVKLLRIRKECRRSNEKPISNAFQMKRWLTTHNIAIQ